jgi:hypothetical protein
MGSPDRSGDAGHGQADADGILCPHVRPISATPPPSDGPAVKVIARGLRSFDAHDADFFLELVPGPRDRDGRPDTIHFWKSNGSRAGGSFMLPDLRCRPPPDPKNLGSLEGDCRIILLRKVRSSGRPAQPASDVPRAVHAGMAHDPRRLVRRVKQFDRLQEGAVPALYGPRRLARRVKQFDRLHDWRHPLA